MSVMFLVVGNLALAFAQQLLVALVLGGADMDAFSTSASATAPLNAFATLATRM